MSDSMVVHDFSELPDLEKMDLEPWGWPKNWGLCIVGTALVSMGVPDGTSCVKFSEVKGEDVIEHFYPIPKNVGFLMRREKLLGRREAQSDMRAALDL